MYWRMLQFSGLNQSPFSNGISYEDFRNGYFVAVFDLSTSGKAGSNFVIPSTRQGNKYIIYNTHDFKAHLQKNKK